MEKGKLRLMFRCPAEPGITGARRLRRSSGRVPLQTVLDLLYLSSPCGCWPCSASVWATGSTALAVPASQLSNMRSLTSADIIRLVVGVWDKIFPAPFRNRCSLMTFSSAVLLARSHSVITLKQLMIVCWPRNF